MGAPVFELSEVTLLRPGGGSGEGAGAPIIVNLSCIIDASVTLVSGPSGSGKTSLLRLLNGLASPSSGRILHAGTDLAEWAPRALRTRVGLLAQQPPALSDTGFGELALAAELSGATPDPARGLHDAEAIGLSRALLEQNPRDLSVGERQRLALIRALSTRAEVLLLDEPTSAQDPTRARQVHELIARKVQDGLQLVIVEHRAEAKTVHRAAARLELSEGRLVS